MTDVTREEFNGLGTRVTTLDKEHAVTKEKTERNEGEIKTIWLGIGDLTKTSATHMDTMRQDNAKSNKDLLTRIVFVFVAGIALMILKDLFL